MPEIGQPGGWHSTEQALAVAREACDLLREELLEQEAKNARLRTENEALRSMLTALDSRGGLGLDVHAAIRKALGKPSPY